MPSRSLLFVGILILAAVGPYLLSQDGPLFSAGNSEAGDEAPSLWQKLVGGSDESSAAADPSESKSTLPIVKMDDLPGRPVESQQLGGPAGISLPDALRFDITPAWIAQNWQRVTTRLADPMLQGVRVPLVTGVEPHDVAGSISYYFNPHNELERIKLVGYTGDYEPLASLLQHRFGMKQYAWVGSALYLGFIETNPVAVLWVEDSTIQTADRPNARYRVELELNAPRSGAILSEPTIARLRRLKTGRLLGS